MADLSMVQTVEGCTPAQSEAAARFVASQAARLGAKADLAEVLGALGLLGLTSPQDGLAPQPAVPGAEPETVASTAPLCPGKRHPRTAQTMHRSPAGRLYCRACESERHRRRRNPDPNADPPALPPLPAGHSWCGCEGEKHVLTPHNSITTYVRSNGTKRCREARRRCQRQYRRGEAA